MFESPILQSGVSYIVPATITTPATLSAIALVATAATTAGSILSSLFQIHHSPKSLGSLHHTEIESIACYLGTAIKDALILAERAEI
ncbi:MAG: hypothetical protein E2598_05665 [Sphingobium sp.]|nr:hypothetical protein [Sphingobium sp.]